MTFSIFLNTTVIVQCLLIDVVLDCLAKRENPRIITVCNSFVTKLFIDIVCCNSYHCN